MKFKNLTFFLLIFLIVLPAFVFLSACSKKDNSDDNNENHYDVVAPVEQPDGSKNNPYLIANASDFAELGEYKNYYYFKLTNNINLNELTNSYIDSSSLIDKFYGSIDGNGYCLTLSNKAYHGWGNVFNYFGGELKNITLNFDNANQEINFCYINDKDVIFYNVTTSGNIYVPFGTTNYSPLVNLAFANLKFENCVNKLNILGLAKYGSAFLGGYVNNEDVEISFINCKNEGVIQMQNASLLFGNSYKIWEDQVNISNCINLGKIYGLSNAELFCALDSSNVTIISTLNNNSQLSNGKDGVVAVKSISGVSVDVNENKEILISDLSNQENTYSVSFSAYFLVKLEDGTDFGTSLIQFDFNLNDAASTNIFKYQLIDNNTWLKLQSDGATRSIISNAEIKTNSGYAGQLYLVSYNNSYFYFIDVTDNSNSTFYFSNGYASPNVNILVFDNNSQPVACFKVL